MLVVVAILGVLAAVVVPNVGKFFGVSNAEAALKELQNIQTGVTALMADQGLSTVTASPASGVTNDMTSFPTGTPLYGGGYNYVLWGEAEFYYECNAEGTVTGYGDAAGTDKIGDGAGDY
jgi:type IV pilus assembly protein PilA